MRYEGVGLRRVALGITPPAILRSGNRTAPSPAPARNNRTRQACCAPTPAPPVAAIKRARKNNTSLGGSSGIDGTKLGENTRPAPCAFGEAPQIVLLIRRMDTVVVEGKADQERIHPELAAGGFDNWNRSAAADHHRLLAPFSFERTRSGLKGRRLRVEAHGARAPFMSKGHACIGRKPFPDEAVQGSEDLVWLLTWNEPEGQLGDGLRWNHGLGARPAIAANDAVDLGGRPRPKLLEHAESSFAGRRA